MTDVLGVCEAWSGGVARIRREDGEVVEIETRMIVSGKPVPPRPSVRMRVDAGEVERHVLSLWDDVDARPLGQWTLRSAAPFEGRLRRRANSVLAFGDPGVPFAEAEAAVRDYYREHDRSPLAQVEAGGDAERAFASAGWSQLPTGEAACQLMSASRLLRTLRGSADPALEVIEDGPRVKMLLDGGDGSGRAAVDGDWVGLHSLVVTPERRGEGLGRALIGALTEWGAQRGATNVWLHVETDNPRAIALYERLGFVTHHVNRYYTAG